MEALVGAIHLDRGFEAARRFVEWVLDDAASVGAAHIDGNYKVRRLTVGDSYVAGVAYVMPKPTRSQRDSLNVSASMWCMCLRFRVICWKLYQVRMCWWLATSIAHRIDKLLIPFE